MKVDKVLTIVKKSFIIKERFLRHTWSMVIREIRVFVNNQHEYKKIYGNQ